MNNVIVLLTVCIASLGLYAQSDETLSARSNTVSLDFKPAKPSIAWISPRTVGETHDVTEFDLRFGVNSESDIKEVLVTINGEKSDLTRGFRAARNVENYDAEYTKRIFLKEGENAVSVLVKNNDGGEDVSDTKIIYVKPKPVFAAGGIGDGRKDYALIIATNEYDSPAWGDLHNPITDAEDIATELQEIYGFETDIITNPTKNDVILKIREYYAKAQNWGENDQLMIFFAGHGYFDPLVRKGYLVFKDGKDPNQDLTFGSYLDFEVLNGYVDRIPADHILLVMDACFGGTFDRMIADAGHRGANSLYQNISAAELIKRRLRYKSRFYITSGGKEYVPDGEPGDNSPFTRQMLGILRRGGNLPGGILTVEIMREQLSLIQGSTPRSGSFGDNEPGSTFLFVPKADF